jgi:hypothetical protein
MEGCPVEAIGNDGEVEPNDNETAWPTQRSERANQKHPREPAFRNASGV